MPDHDFEEPEWPPTWLAEVGLTRDDVILDGVPGKNWVPPSGSDPSPANRGSDPTDRAMRVFVVVAQTGSLTAAAKVLGVGQPAVSLSMRSLEEALGVILLIRSRNGVTPTAVGQELLDELAPAYDRIDRATQAVGVAEPEVVSLSVSTSFASWWLLPRLPDFKRSHPEVPLRLVTADSDDRMDINTIDLWIPLGHIEAENLHSVNLCREALVPVASPDLAATIGSDPADLLTAPLLHLEERYSPRFDWDQWFKAKGTPAPARLPGDRSTDYSLIIQAALEGQGVALGWEHIVRDLVAYGHLVALAEPIVTDSPFVVLNPSQRPLSADASALRNWLVDQLAV